MPILQLEFNGSPLSAGNYFELPDRDIQSGYPVTPSVLVLKNDESPGGASVTLTAFSNNNQVGKLITFPSNPSTSGTFNTPITIPANSTYDLDIAVRSYLDNAPEPIPTSAQITLTYQFQGDIVRTITIRPKALLADSSLDPFSLSDEEILRRTWAGWSVRSGTPSPTTYGFGWVTPFTYDAFYETRMKPMMDDGFLNHYLWVPFGQRGGDVDIAWDSWSTLKKDIPAIPPTIYDMFEAVENDHPDARFIWYLGTLRQDPRIQSLMSARDLESAFQYVVDAVEPILQCPIESILALDVPYNTQLVTSTNPRMTDGEFRFELMQMLRNYFALRGVATLVEPRIPQAETQLLPARGWGRALFSGNYHRNNPKWFSDAIGATTDEEMAAGPMTTVWWINGFPNGSNAPEQAAEILYQGWDVVLANLRLYHAEGNNASDYLTAVKDIFARLTSDGSASE